MSAPAPIVRNWAGCPLCGATGYRSPGAPFCSRCGELPVILFQPSEIEWIVEYTEEE